MARPSRPDPPPDATQKSSTLTRRRGVFGSPDAVTTAALLALSRGATLVLAAERDASGGLVDVAITAATDDALTALDRAGAPLPIAGGDALVPRGGAALLELLGRATETAPLAIPLVAHGGRDAMTMQVVACGGGFAATLEPDDVGADDLGLLAARLSHEFNNLLQTVRSAADALSLERSASRGELDAINLAVVRMAAITRQLQTFTRQQVRQPVELELNEWLATLSSLLRGIVGASASLDLDLWRAELRVRVDPVQLELALINLLESRRGAIEARGGGVVSLVTEPVTATAAAPVPGLAHGAYARIVVRDDAGPASVDGPGLGGAGLGVASVRRVAADAGGALVEGAERHGNGFELYLPLVEVARRSMPPPDRTTTSSAPEELRVLVVDDEPSILRGASRLLQRIGYNVVTAGNAAEALEVLTREAPIDLVITDYAMPGSTGTELLQVVRAEWPEVATILMSGHTGDPAARAELLKSETVFLAKPFSVDELQRAVERVLASRRVARPSV